MDYKCFYHKADLDGKCSAAIVLKVFPECEMFPITYGDEFPWYEIKSTDTVIMVDFSLHIDDMIELDNRCYNLCWIDHHATAINDAAKHNFNPDGIRVNGRAGCELTWEWFYPHTSEPAAIYYLGRYDVWDHKHKFTVPFQMGARMLGLDPSHTAWDELLMPSHEKQVHHKLLSDLIDQGKIIIEYEKQQNKELCDDYAFDTLLEGFSVAAVNSVKGSYVLDSVKDDHHDIVSTFAWDGKQWLISIYSDKPYVNCGEIAKKFGGGGHKGAAGFELKELPWPSFGLNK